MSRIARIEPFALPYVETNDAGSIRWVCLVKVVDDDGAEGWGEAVTLFPEAAQATATLIRGWEGLLVGVEADPEVLDDVIDRHAWWYGDAGISRFAQSAIDIALWDLTSLRACRPLSDILGRAQPTLPFLMSTHATERDLDQMAATLAASVSEHAASGIKVGFGKRGDAALGLDHDRDVAFVAALRRELGPAARIMIDIGARIRWTPDEAVRRILAFEAHDIAWTEEPLGADDPDGYALLRRAVHSPIAFGEREWSPKGYARIVASGTVDVVGIDPGRVGGITGFLRATEVLEAAGVQGNAHAFSGPIVYAASVALSLASPVFRQLEITPRRNGLYDLVHFEEAPRRGSVHAATRPGLGVVVDEQRVRRAAQHGLS